MTDTARQELIAALPYARRFARALAGDQAQGDRLVASALKDLLAEGEA
ncbi:regulator, partial [Gluconobacter japonicus]